MLVSEGCAGSTPHLGILEELAQKAREQECWPHTLPAAALRRMGPAFSPESKVCLLICPISELLECMKKAGPKLQDLHNRATTEYLKGILMRIQYDPCRRSQRPHTRPVTHCNEHLQVKLCGQRYTVAHHSFHTEIFIKLFSIFYFL